LVKKRLLAVLPPLPPSGAFWFFDTIEERGQTRAMHVMIRLFLISLAAAALARFLPPLLGYRQLSWIWMIPVIFGGLALMFWATKQCFKLSGTRLWLFQLATTLVVFTFFLTLYLWLGGRPDTSARWSSLLLERSDDRDLLFTAFGLGTALGWTIHRAYPLRGLILVMLLVFMATWMDLQGYYIVLHDGGSIWVPGYIDNSTTHRLSDIPDNDSGRAFVAMTMVTLATCVPLGAWLIFKRLRTSNSKVGRLSDLP